MGFRNEAVGGEILVRPAIQSPNFVDGSAGWSINQNGTAEFQSLIVGAGQIQAGALGPNAVTSGTIAPGALDTLTLNAVTINGNTVSASNIIITQGAGGIFIYSAGGGQVVQTFTTAGSGHWIAPTGVTSIKAEAWGGGGGGSGNYDFYHATQGSGGGGEYAAETALAVTAGNSYAYTVGSAGAGDTGSSLSTNGGGSTLAGDSVTVTAHGGVSGSNGSTQGTGSTNTVHFDGGQGVQGWNFSQSSNPGGSGGGSSAGPSSAGNSGSFNDGTLGGSGGAAVSDGGPGGAGGHGSTNHANAPAITSGPGGGGGEGGLYNNEANLTNGASGFAGQVRITYTASGTTLIMSIAASATTDPVSGASVPAGPYLLAGTALAFQGTTGENTHGKVAAPAARQLQLTAPMTNSTDVQPSVTLNSVATGSIPFTAVSGSVTLSNQAATPSSPSSAALLYGTSGQPAFVNPQGVQANLSGAPLADTSTNTVTSTGINALTKIWTIPANDMQVGTTYKLTCWGNAVWGSTQQTLTLSPEIDGALVGTNPGIAGADFAASATIRWHAELFVTCHATGAGGSIQFNGWGTFCQTDHVITPGTAANNTVPWASGISSDFSVDTTASHTVSLKANWASTTGAPTISCHNSLFERIC